MGNEVKHRNKKFINSFGKHLRELRTSKGLTQEALADLANVDYTQVNDIENGRINTTIATVSQLAKGLKIHPKELFDF